MDLEIFMSIPKKDIEVFRKIINMARNRLEFFKKEEGFLPPLEQKALDMVCKWQLDHPELI